MDTGLKGRTVLITGASRNMGRLAALAFAREGANLALCTSAKMNELQQVAAEARALGVKVVAERCDVADAAAVFGFVKKVRNNQEEIYLGYATFFWKDLSCSPLSIFVQPPLTGSSGYCRGTYFAELT